MTYVVVGGSSGLGRALAERFAAAGQDLVLVSRDQRDSATIAGHLEIKYNVKASAVALDLGAADFDCGSLDEALAAHPPLEGLLLPVGANDVDDAVGLADDRLEFLTRVNYLAPCKIINHFLPQLENSRGVIIGFGSVATARGRSRNAAYAAAKNALQMYFESLRHHAAGRNLHCQFYVLGYLDTNLAFSQDLLFPLAKPERLADIVYRRRYDDGRRFLPRFWYIVYRLVQFLPWTLFKRLSF